MKLKIGQKLQTIREERKLSQHDFADMLEMSTSAYSRIERGETSVNVDEILRYASKLNIPIQDLLPDIISLHANNTNSTQSSGVIFGNIYNYNYYEKGDIIKELNEKIMMLENIIKKNNE